MTQQRFVVQKIGEQFVPVSQGEQSVAAKWLVGGGVLAGAGFVRGGLFGTAALLAGAGMIYRALTGKNPLQEFGCHQAPEAERYGPSYQHDDKISAAQRPEDGVEEASMESFPASDAPARSASTGPSA